MGGVTLFNYFFSAWSQIIDSQLLDTCAGLACVCLVVLVCKMIFSRSGN